MNASAFGFQKPKTFSDIAREMLDEAGGDTSVAIARLQARIAEDEALRISIAGAAIRVLVAEGVTLKMRLDRKTIWDNATKKGDTPKPKTSVSALANGIRESLLDFPLAGGKRLRDAVREEVEAQAQLYAATSRDAGHKARWLTAIATRMDDGATVSDAISEAEVVALHQETANA